MRDRETNCGSLVAALMMVFGSACATTTPGIAQETSSVPLTQQVSVSQGSASQVSTSQPRPKYGPEATRLYLAQDYVRKNPAPDFWALMPYYLPQQNGRSCSVASVAMVMNAARANQNLTASDELVTHDGLLKTVKSKVWSRAVGNRGKGVTLDQLGELIEKTFKSYGFEKAKIEVVHADDTSDTMRQKLHQALAKSEQSTNDFIIANFLQSEYTGDPEGAVGHIAPIAAYDEANQRVLVFDPDRQYYEPYWVSENTLLKGMSTLDPVAKKMRGFIYITLSQ